MTDRMTEREKRTEATRQRLKARARLVRVEQARLRDLLATVGPLSELAAKKRRLESWNGLLISVLSVYTGIEISRAFGLTGSLGEMVAGLFR